MRLFPELATCHDVSIPELLASRDERQARQRAWLTRHATPLVSFTVVAPGPIKDSALTRRIFNHGVTALHTLAEEYGWRRHFALPARRCLLCGQSAAECARGKTHALTDLLIHMEALLDERLHSASVAV